MIQALRTTLLPTIFTLFLAACGGAEVPKPPPETPADPPKPTPSASSSVGAPPTNPQTPADSSGPSAPDRPAVPPAPPSRALTVDKSIQLGKWPEALYVADGSAWITESGARSVAHVDLETNTVKKRVAVGRLPVQIVSGPDEILYTVCETDQTIWSIHRSTYAAKAFARVADSPHGMVFADGALWVLAWKGNSSADSSIVRIELPSGKLTQSAALGANAWDLGVGFGRVWVAHGKQISVVDQKTLAPLADLAITVTDSMHLAIGTNAVYITDGGSVERIDPTSGQVTHKAMLGELVYVLQNAGEEIVAATQPGKIYRLDAATLAIKEILTPAKDAYEPADLHVAGPQLFVLTHASLAGGANKEAGTLFVAK